jgi:hypothetical protein
MLKGKFHGHMVVGIVRLGSVAELVVGDPIHKSLAIDELSLPSLLGVINPMLTE